MSGGSVECSNVETPVLVIGIGNSCRGDDSVGRIVVRMIKRRNLPFLRAIEHEGEGTSLMELWRDAGSVIVVDAVTSGSVTGTVHRFDPAKGYATEFTAECAYLGGAS